MNASVCIDFLKDTILEQQAANLLDINGRPRGSCRGEVESGKPSLNLGLIVPHSLFREKQYRYTIYGRSLAWSGRVRWRAGSQWWANLDQTPNDLDKTIFRDLSPTPLP